MTQVRLDPRPFGLESSTLPLSHCAPTITNRRQPYGTARKSHSIITRHQEDKLSKATSSLFPIKIIAILELTQSNVQQNIVQLQHARIQEFSSGGGGVQVSLTNKELFFSPQLILRSLVVNFKEIYHFSSFLRGSNIFQGVQLLIPYRNPYNL